jgi:hypothetical protein
MNWLQIRLFGPYFSSFSTNSYGYYSQMCQNLFSNGQIFASALKVRQAASGGHILSPGFSGFQRLKRYGIRPVSGGPLSTAFLQQEDKQHQTCKQAQL